MLQFNEFSLNATPLTLFRSRNKHPTVMTEFYIYENWTRKRGAIHCADCSHCNEGKGTQPEDSGRNGKWHGPYDRNDAFRRAAGMQNIEPCKTCRSPPPA